MSPRTTVITVTYNRPEWLAEAVASVEEQTDHNWEHLVYDNGSTNPRVDEILYAATERAGGRFRYFHAVNNRDIVAPHWNFLLERARGEYVTILDDDNRKRPDFIERMIAPMEVDLSVDAVSCGWAVIDGSGKPTGEERHLNVATTLERLWYDNTIDSNAMVFRRSALGRVGLFDASLSTNEDWDFVIRLVRHCRMVHLPDALLD